LVPIECSDEFSRIEGQVKLIESKIESSLLVPKVEKVNSSHRSKRGCLIRD